MDNGDELRTNRTIFAFIRVIIIPVIFIMWVILTMTYLFRSIGVFGFAITRIAIISYEGGDVSIPQNNMTMFVNQYVKISKNCLDSAWNYQRISGTYDKTGLQFWPDLVFFNIAGLIYTVVNYKRELFVGIFTSVGSNISSSGEMGLARWVVATYSILSVIAIFSLFTQSGRESSITKALAFTTAVLGGLLLFFSFFGW